MLRHQDSARTLGGTVRPSATPPVKIRDFAFPETDPRHVGARDVSAPHPAGPEFYAEGEEAEEDWGLEQDADEDEFAGGAAGTGDEEMEGVEEEGEGEEGLPEGIYVAVYDFEAESAHELAVRAGERVRVVGALEGGWAVVQREGEGTGEREEEGKVERGLVPEAYLEWAEG